MTGKRRILLIAAAWCATPIAAALLVRGCIASQGRQAEEPAAVAIVSPPVAPPLAVQPPAAAPPSAPAAPAPVEPAPPPARAPAPAPALAAPGGAGLLALSLPIACEPGVTCVVQSYMDHDPGPGAKDYRCGSRAYDKHSGIDIRIPSLQAMKDGVPVLAAAAGTVRVVRDGMADLSIRDRVGGTNNQDCGNAAIVDHPGGWATQYCHMRQGTVRVKAGDVLRAGQVIGLVGLTGNTEFPHVHLTVYHGREIVDPFAHGAPPEACGGGQSLWTPAVAAKLAYRQREMFGAGFTTGPVDFAAVETGTLDPPSRSSGAMVAYVRAIGLKAGDEQSLKIVGPDGSVVAQSTAAGLPRDQAQRLMFVGGRLPAGGWKPGLYQAQYTVRQNGAVMLDRRFEVRL